jgi:hypothetical protein
MTEEVPTTEELPIPKRTVNLRIDVDAYETIRQYAKANERTISWVINDVLTKVAAKMKPRTL